MGLGCRKEVAAGTTCQPSGGEVKRGKERYEPSVSFAERNGRVEVEDISSGELSLAERNGRVDADDIGSGKLSACVSASWAGRP